MLTYKEFEKKYLGRPVDYDGVAGVQCVDLIDAYLRECYGIIAVWVQAAREFYTKFETYSALKKYFTKIPNTRDLVIQQGDIVVWGGGSWGHVAIGTGVGNIDCFESLEENTRGKHEPTQKVVHFFAGRSGDDCCGPVLGVLRPKPTAEETVTVTYTIKKKYKKQLDAYVKTLT